MPNDPIMLLSFVNTKLRDDFSNPSDLAKAFGKRLEDISAKLNAINYFYDAKTNQFK